MKRIIEYLQEDIKKNRSTNYGGLFIIFSLVDACAKIEYPTNNGVGKRYKNWLDKFYLGTINSKYPNNNDPQLTSNEFYNARCTLLHEAKISEEEVRTSENKRRVIFADMGVSIMGNICHNDKQSVFINVNRFIDNVIYCIEKWMENKNPNEYKLTLDINTTYKMGDFEISGGKEKGLSIKRTNSKLE